MSIRVIILRATTAIALLGHAAGAQDQQGLLSRFHKPPQPPTLTDIGRMIDHVQDGILDQGTVVIKHPDVWSQARMTKFRKEFEEQMKGELGSFKAVLAARIARTDSAGFSSQTALGASLTPQAPGTAGIATDAAGIRTERDRVFNTAFGLQPGGDSGLPPLMSTSADFTLLNSTIPGSTAGMNAPQDITASIGLEPSIYLDEKKYYLDHLHALRRENLSDDISDSAGYALYLVRLPVSINPGDKTKKGYGAVVNLTVSHDFGPKFLPLTYRNLVLNDVVDQLAPVVYEMIRKGDAKDYNDNIFEYARLKSKNNKTNADVARLGAMDSGAVEEARSRLLKKVSSFQGPRGLSRAGERIYPIAPSDVKRVYVNQNLLNLAYAAQVALGLGDDPKPYRVRAAEIRTYLRQELEAAFDLMEGRGGTGFAPLMDVEYIENLTDQVYTRRFEGPKGVMVNSEEEFNEFYRLYEEFTRRLPGNLRFRPVGVLCWAIAVDAGLLNRQLREDMKQTKGGEEGYACPDDVDNLHFYPPTPLPEADLAFQRYVKARWPMITFSLQPVTDEQNVADSFSRKRDLQLAVSFALASGRISFRQANQFSRQLQYEAETIDLNRTVTAFVHGNDTFGWKFMPRYQTPPEESNIQALGNLLLRGGPGPNYQIKNSKLEAGQRELNAVVVMPSFVRGIRVDVANNWFHLDDPDDRKVHTARTLEQGRKINEIRQALACVCDAGLYRPEDIERLKVRLHQLERSLPMQTEFVKVPYENTLGGFALFTQGTSALVPELDGFEGIDAYDPDQHNEVLVYGKHISIHETALVVGGRSIPNTPPRYPIVLKGDDGRPITDPAAAMKSPYALIDALGNPVSAAGASGPYLGDFGGYEVLSREVVRVRIPPGAQVITKDGDDYLEMYVATPNGISNHLLIPVLSPRVAAPSAPGAPVLLKTPKATIAYTIAPGDKDAITLVHNERHSTPGTVDIQLTTPVAVSPATIDVIFDFVASDATRQKFSVTSGPLKPDSSTYPIPIRAIAENMVAAATRVFANRGTNPGAATRLITVQATVQPSGASPTGVPADIPLTIAFEYDDRPADASQDPKDGPPPLSAPAGPGNGGKPIQRPTPLEALPQTRRRGPELDAMARAASLSSAAASFQHEVPRGAGATRTGAPILGLPAQVPGSTPGVASPPLTSASRPPRIPAQPSQTVVVMPGARPLPNNITVTVPVQNQLPDTKSRGLFHRNKNATPANPTRPPLMERLRERISP